MSGLNIGSSHCDQLSLQLFIDYITGSVGGAAGHCSNIVRLIVAGNSITDNPVKSSTANDDTKVNIMSLQGGCMAFVDDCWHVWHLGHIQR